MRNSTRFMLAACILAVSPAAASAATRHSWMSPGALGRSGSSALVFVADTQNNVVNIYSASGSGSLVGQVAGMLSLPASLAVDASNNLYIYNARTNSILEFAPPYTGTPIKTFFDQLSGISSLSVDAGGTIYTANYYKIVEYPHGSTRGKVVSLPVNPTSATVDARGRLVSGFQGGGSSGVLRMARHSPIPESLLIPLDLNSTDVLYDAGGNLVVEDNVGYINVYKPGAKKPSVSWTAGLIAPLHMAFSADQQTLYVTDQGNNTLTAYSYPSGQQLWRLSGFASVNGVAVSPAAVPGGRNTLLAPFPAVDPATLDRPIPPNKPTRNHFISLAPHGPVAESHPAWARFIDPSLRRFSGSQDEAWVSPIGYPAPVQRYALPNNNNGAPNCATPNFYGVNNIGTDPSGNLWVPSYNNGPRTGTAQQATCGSTVGAPINDYIGQPSDIAFDGKGNAVVGDIVDFYPYNGGWYLESGTANAYDSSGKNLGTLSDPTFFGPHPPGFDTFNLLYAVASDPNGNCYISHDSNSGGGEVVEFAGCKPAKHGKVLKGPHPWRPGKVTFDAAGNLLVTDFAAIYYYRIWYVAVYAPPYDGKPISTFPMYGPAVSCGLDSTQTNLYCANTWNGTIDAYSYPAGQYEFSFNSGLQTWGASGIAIVHGGARK